jgi:TPR repeat protein
MRSSFRGLPGAEGAGLGSALPPLGVGRVGWGAVPLGADLEEDARPAVRPPIPAFPTASGGKRKGRAFRLLLGIAFSAFAAALPTAAVEPEPDLAYGAYQTGHYRRAQSEALKRVEADPGDAAAMTLLGEIYRQGLGIREDARAAADWYRLAAERGDINAVFALGMAMLEGRGTARDPARAGTLLEKAANAGHPAANYNLALALLATGRPQDDQRAIGCLRVAAAADLGDAQHALAVLYKLGRGLPQDDGMAAEWMAKAAANGLVAGEVEYAIMLFNGDGVGKDERAAARLFIRAANKGNAIAQNRLAKLYQLGRAVPPDLSEAAAWHLAARTQGLADATLDQVLERLTPEQRSRAARLAADRIEATALTTPSQPSK